MELIDDDGEAVVIRLRRDEVITLNNALNEILNGPDAIDEWEFHTRVGATQAEATALLDAIARLLV